MAYYQDALADADSGAMEGQGGVLSHYDDIDPVTGEARKAATADGREVCAWSLARVSVLVRGR